MANYNRIISIHGNGHVYSFCLHDIDIKTQNILLSNRMAPGRSLHDFGKGPFCEFRIADHLKEKGLYCFVVNGKVKYIGKVTGKSTFGKRFNNGYGHISPYNCYKAENGHSGGRLTNCHINSLINKESLAGNVIKIGFHVMIDDDNISLVEKTLIQENNPDWNIQFNHHKEVHC